MASAGNTATANGVMTGLRARSAGAALCATGAFALSLSMPAAAYVGPGAGLGVLGVLLAVFAAVLMALIGMVLWPIRLITQRNRLKARHAGAQSSRAEDASESGGLEQNAQPERPGTANGQYGSTQAND